MALEVWDEIMTRLFAPIQKAAAERVEEKKIEPVDCGHPENFYKWVGDGWDCKECQTHIAYP